MTLEAYTRIAALGYGSILHAKFGSNFAVGLENAAAKSVFFTSRPVTAGAVKPWISFWFLIFASIFLVFGVWNFLQVCGFVSVPLSLCMWVFMCMCLESEGRRGFFSLMVCMFSTSGGVCF